MTLSSPVPDQIPPHSPLTKGGRGDFPMTTLNVLTGLAFVDSFFPNGGFAHSFGLETAVAEGRVRGASDVSGYLAGLIRDGVGSCDGVALAVAHGAVVNGDVHLLVEVDLELDAFKLAREAREGSRLMGRRYAESGAERFPNSAVARFHARIQRGDTPGHAAVAMGAVLATCGWSCRDAVAAGLYQGAVGWVSAAVRLLPMGQREGQRVLHELLPVIDEAVRDAEDADVDGMRSWTPLHDIRAMRHARQDVRLFRS